MKLFRLPGLIDPHVHLRDMGQNEKEDFFTGTSAALAGGFTTVIDMPNNPTPITTRERLEEKITMAKEKVVCDIGFYFGTLGDNLEEFKLLRHSGKPLGASRISQNQGNKRNNRDSGLGQNDEKTNSEYLVHGLKIYLNHTTGNFILDKDKLKEIFAAWPKQLPILFHAEEETFDTVLELVRQSPRPIHLCHMTTKYELEHIIEAKEAGLPVTCGVTPHHLFLTDKDTKTLGPFGMMKPVLKPQRDVDFLWKHLNAIDVIESDHAPHTKEEKELLPTPFGVPGLETTLPLLLTAAHEGRSTIDEIIRLCHTNPAKIFNVPTDKTTFVEVDPNEHYEISNKNLFTKCQWTPFNGWKMTGAIKRVVIRGTTAFADHKIRVSPGWGRYLPRL